MPQVFKEIRPVLWYKIQMSCLQLKPSIFLKRRISGSSVLVDSETSRVFELKGPVSEALVLLYEEGRLSSARLGKLLAERSPAFRSITSKPSCLKELADYLRAMGWTASEAGRSVKFRSPGNRR